VGRVPRARFLVRATYTTIGLLGLIRRDRALVRGRAVPQYRGAVGLLPEDVCAPSGRSRQGWL